jgi:hypothetical protein
MIGSLYQNKFQIKYKSSVSDLSILFSNHFLKPFSQTIFSNHFSNHSTALPPEGGEMPLLQRRGGDRYVQGNLGMKII